MGGLLTQRGHRTLLSSSGRFWENELERERGRGSVPEARRVLEPPFPAHSHRQGASCCPRLLGARGHPACALPLSVLREWPQPAPRMLSQPGALPQLHRSPGEWWLHPQSPGAAVVAAQCVTLWGQQLSPVLAAGRAAGDGQHS